MAAVVSTHRPCDWCEKGRCKQGHTLPNQSAPAASLQTLLLQQEVELCLVQGSGDSLPLCNLLSLTSAGWQEASGHTSDVFVTWDCAVISTLSMGSVSTLLHIHDSFLQQKCKRQKGLALNWCCWSQ